MNNTYLYVNSLIVLLGRISIYLTMLHFVFTYSSVHAIILLSSFIAMEVSKVYIHKTLTKVNAKPKQIEVDQQFTGTFN